MCWPDRNIAVDSACSDLHRDRRLHCIDEASTITEVITFRVPLMSSGSSNISMGADAPHHPPPPQQQRGNQPGNLQSALSSYDKAATLASTSPDLPMSAPLPPQTGGSGADIGGPDLSILLDFQRDRSCTLGSLDFHRDRSSTLGSIDFDLGIGPLTPTGSADPRPRVGAPYSSVRIVGGPGAAEESLSQRHNHPHGGAEQRGGDGVGFGPGGGGGGLAGPCRAVSSSASTAASGSAYSAGAAAPLSSVGMISPPLHPVLSSAAAMSTAASSPLPPAQPRPLPFPGMHHINHASAPNSNGHSHNGVDGDCNGDGDGGSGGVDGGVGEQRRRGGEADAAGPGVPPDGRHVNLALL